MNPPNAPNKREEITAQIDNVEEAKVNARFASLTRKAVASSIDLTEQAIEMKAAMEVLVCHWKAEWLTFQQTCDTRIQELRQTRMAMETEMRLILSQLREVRGFFLERDYEQERARLAEFVDVCERLKALKESGFLDAVADTLLKLADRPETPPEP